MKHNNILLIDFTLRLYISKLYSKYCEKPITYGNEYRIMRNRINNLVKTRKKLYYQNSFDSYQNDCKKTWKLLNAILNRNIKKKLSPS